MSLLNSATTILITIAVSFAIGFIVGVCAIMTPLGF